MDIRDSDAGYLLDSSDHRGEQVSHTATLPVWLTILEEKHGGSVRKAAAHFGIEPSYWWRMKDGEAKNPSADTLKALMLREVMTLYEIDEP